LPFAFAAGFRHVSFRRRTPFLEGGAIARAVTAAAIVQILAKRCRIAPLPFDQSGSDIDVALPKLPKDLP